MANNQSDKATFNKLNNLLKKELGKLEEWLF